MTSTHAPALHAPSITKRLRRNGVDVYSHLHAPGVVRVWTIENDADAAIRRASAVLIQAGYEVATATGYEGALLVTLPVEESEDTEPVIVRAGQAAPLAQHDAPRQDLDGEFRYDEQGLRYLTADEVAAESDRRADAGEPVATLVELEETVARYVVRTSPNGGRDTVAGEFSTLEEAEQLAERLRASGSVTSTIRPCGHGHNRYRTNPACRTCGALPEPVTEPTAREVVEEALAPSPVHYSREDVYARFREVDEFVLVLGPDDRAYDPETGDTLLGGVTVRYSRGEFPGTAYRATIVDDEPAVDDDPREQPEPLEWSEVAGRPEPAGLDLLGDDEDEAHPSRGDRDHLCSGRYCSTCADRAVALAARLRS